LKRHTSIGVIKVKTELWKLHGTFWAKIVW